MKNVSWEFCTSSLHVRCRRCWKAGGSLTDFISDKSSLSHSSWGRDIAKIYQSIFRKIFRDQGSPTHSKFRLKERRSYQIFKVKLGLWLFPLEAELSERFCFCFSRGCQWNKRRIMFYITFFLHNIPKRIICLKKQIKMPECLEIMKMFLNWNVVT